MLRIFRSGSRNPTHILTSSPSRWPKPPQSITKQLRIASRSSIPRHGPRTNNNHHNHNQSHSQTANQQEKGPRHLHAHIYGAIYMSIAFLVLNEELDWNTRQDMGIDTVERIMLEPDAEIAIRKFYATGESILAAYSGYEPEHHEDAVRVPADSGFGSKEVETRMLTAPDPEVEGGVLVLCLVALRDSYEETYLTMNVNGNRISDATHVMLSEIEGFAARLPGNPRVRGAAIVLEKEMVGKWMCIYWDGRRWINMIFLEWQTPGQMGQGWRDRAGEDGYED